MDASSDHCDADPNANLFPYFHRDRDGNIIARYRNGERVAIVHTNRIAHFASDRNADGDANANQHDDSGTEQNHTDDGRGESG